jgi:hypothetical protein
MVHRARGTTGRAGPNAGQARWVARHAVQAGVVHAAHHRHTGLNQRDEAMVWAPGAPECGWGWVGGWGGHGKGLQGCAQLEAPGRTQGGTSTSCWR